MKPSDLMSYATVASQGYYNFVSDRGRKKVTQNTLWLQVSRVSQGQMHIEHVTGGGEKHKERDFRESTFTHSEGKKKALTRMTSITKKTPMAHSRLSFGKPRENSFISVMFNYQ